jgi:hypothetical protein
VDSLEVYIAALVLRVGSSCDAATVTRTLQDDFSINTVQDLLAAAEQLPFVVPEDFPKEILSALKPTFEVVNLHHRCIANHPKSSQLS